MVVGWTPKDPHGPLVLHAAETAIYTHWLGQWSSVTCGQHLVICHKVSLIFKSATIRAILAIHWPQRFLALAVRYVIKNKMY